MQLLPAMGAQLPLKSDIPVTLGASLLEFVTAMGTIMVARFYLILALRALDFGLLLGSNNQVSDKTQKIGN
jgi:hypothetical protein